MNPIFRTEIYDVNGQELELGDIAKTSHSTTTFEVVFEKGGFRRKYRNWSKKRDGDYPYLVDINTYLIVSKKQVEKDIQELFYVQASGMYLGNAIAFCGVNNCGYVYDLTEAGKFTKDKASDIIENSSMNRDRNVAWSCDYIDTNLKAQKLVIDAQYLDHSQKITE